MVPGSAVAARVCYPWSNHGAEEVQGVMLDSNKLMGNTPPWEQALCEMLAQHF